MNTSIVAEVLSEYFRAPEDHLGNVSTVVPSGRDGFFRFGSGAIGYGQFEGHVASNYNEAEFCDALTKVTNGKTGIQFPCDPSRVIQNLRHERYEKSLRRGRKRILSHEWALKAYYRLRGGLPSPLRRFMQRAYLSDWKSIPFPAWPVDFTVDSIHELLLRISMDVVGLHKIPFIWFWPDGAQNCLILTHDVETSAGRDFTSQLMELDTDYGLRASFQIVPERRYEVSDQLVQEIRSRGFEFNIHDLNHDGHLYEQRGQFLQRAKKINEYVHQYGASGFRAGSMYRNLDWYDAFEFSYDMSVPNVAHLEPKRGGCCTVFPFFVGDILELPLTTSEDYSVLHILKDYSIDLWKKQFDLIRRRNGLIQLLAHPDYLLNHRTRRVYESLLNHTQEMVSRESVWTALPGEVDRWWRARARMKLVQKGAHWGITGSGSERARVAFAIPDGDHLAYEVDGNLATEDVRNKHVEQTWNR